MRITQNLLQTQFLASLGALESNLAQTQNQVSTGLAFTSPAQNPAAAGNVNTYDQLLSQSQQYTANANSAQTNLNTEGNALTQVQSQLQTLRSLALEANSGTMSQQNLAAIATQAAQIQQSLIGTANTQNGNGDYIFAGYSSQTQPFTQSASGATYAGDQGQLHVQIAAGQTIATGDNGNTVFNQIKTGNGTFTVGAAAGNTGSGLIGASAVTDPTAYTGGSYSIKFTAANAYQVLDSTNAVVSSGAYVPGQAISFSGVQVTLSGQPATGDSFAVAPSANQSVFTTVQNLVDALNSASAGPLNSTALSNTISGTLNNLDQAMSNVSTVQASVGGRLNAITFAQSIGTTQQTQLQQSISNLQSLDYPAAITSLTNDQTALSASMQAYTLTQGLTLFKYL
ncbi:MAG: flagellar hook-associated protein FlgL [Gammaproteobacteria bacterium]|nr:flagellar hook-associated protein FlgL [Gammaproteobacteria bacterium]